ncbi:hypothetical protein LB579_31515 [Mesorhizobium sp. BR1-1-7]|uniref:hypothetical protein n=1 Tax=Mesorhizobium sp. BR1-1-7 TaxID=2876647 RepID=UPI001CCBC84E|nr:hypothetical protein [Mesorhizobium sp. BR1-1-7]MBZ9922210.1 hypothetical protein [Mesorhizobium sp. BR1-1-7]
MNTNWIRKRERKTEVKSRAAEPSHMFTRCRVIGCDRPARAGTDDGLDTRFCRQHSDHYSRHGSPYKGSYTAKELAPYRKAACAWLEVNAEDQWVRNAVDRVETLYRAAGPHIEAFRLRGLSPEERAKAAWARLRKAKVDPRRVVAAWLAVEMATAADPQADRKPEYRRVQAAKLVHRMASGTHRRWESGPGGAQELHAYPRSRGRVLRHIGESIEEATALLIEHTASPMLQGSRYAEGSVST